MTFIDLSAVYDSMTRSVEMNHFCKISESKEDTDPVKAIIMPWHEIKHYFQHQCIFAIENSHNIELNATMFEDDNTENEY